MAEDTTTTTAPDDDDSSLDDVSLINTDIAPPGKDDSSSSDSADKGKDDAAGADDKGDDSKTGDDKSDAKGTEATDTKEDKTDAGEAKTDDQQSTEDQRTPEEIRAEQNRIAQQEYQNRQRTKQQIAQQIDKTFGPKTEQELIDEGMDEADAKLEAFKQDLAYKESRAQIAELNAGMQADAVNVEADFPIFNPKSPEYDAEFTEMVNNQYRTAARVQMTEIGKDREGKPIEVVTNAEVPLYDFFKQMATIHSRGASQGAKKGAEDMQNMMSRTENPGGSSSSNKGDSLAELEERLGDMVIT